MELRYFGGMSVEETAEVLKVSPQTLMRDWNMAKLWLLLALRHGARADEEEQGQGARGLERGRGPGEAGDGHEEAQQTHGGATETSGRSTDAMSPLDRIKRVFDETPGMRLAVLFGSAARRADTRGSKINKGVLWLDGVGHEVSGLPVDLKRAARRGIDLVCLDEAPALVRLKIARDGVVLVERVPHAWADFRARAMIDWWDWAPTARMMHRVMAARLREEAARGPA